jgi:hypothetical protein
MTTAKLHDLKSIDDIARACGVEPYLVTTYANSSDQKGYYLPLKIAKHGKRRKGEFRIVFPALQAWLSGFHRSVSMIVVNSTTFGDHVQGFLKGRSTRTNAKQHLAANVLLHADIKNFFDAITTQHVRDAFVTEGMSLPVADFLARACTIDGLLRQGTRCSPVIANLVCYPLDQALLRLASSHGGCVYTRYADDITFSGNKVPPDESVRQVLASCGFVLRDDKCFRQFKGRCQFVTGLTVADKDAPRLPRALKQRLRQTMYYIEKFGIAEHFDRIGSTDVMNEVAWLSGMLKYAASIEPKLVRPWQEILDAAWQVGGWDSPDPMPDSYL